MKKKAKYGYIEFIDKRKLKHDGWDDEIEPEIRKPTRKIRQGQFLCRATCGIRTHDTNSVEKSRKQRLDQTNPSSARQKKTSRIYPVIYRKTENPISDRSHIEKSLRSG